MLVECENFSASFSNVPHSDILEDFTKYRFNFVLFDKIFTFTYLNNKIFTAILRKSQCRYAKIRI